MNQNNQQPGSADKASIDSNGAFTFPVNERAPSPQVAEELPPLPKPKAPATEYFSNEPVYSAAEVEEIRRDAITASRRAPSLPDVAMPELIYQKHLGGGSWSDEEKADYDAREDSTWRVVYLAAQPAKTGYVLVDAQKLMQAAVQVKTGISARGMELLDELAQAAKSALAAQPAEGSAQVAKVINVEPGNAFLAPPGYAVNHIGTSAAALLAAEGATPAGDAPNMWQKFGTHTRFHAHRRFDVVLTNGVTEYDRMHEQIDWTQVADWRYSRIDGDKHGEQGGGK